MKVKNIDNRKIIYEAGWSFKYDSDTQLTTSLHCHAEYELIYIISGHGKEFIGDSVREYAPGDLILIGANLPHLYLADVTIDAKDNLCSIIQFPQEIFPEKWNQYRNILRYMLCWKKVLKESSSALPE